MQGLALAFNCYKGSILDVYIFILLSSQLENLLVWPNIGIHNNFYQ